MINLNDTKRQASELRKQKSYAQAVPLYKDLWENHPDDCNEWDGWGYAFCLRKVGQVDQAYQVAQQVYEKWPNFEMNCGLLAWCIYDLKINRDPEAIKQDESDYFGSVNKILELTGQDHYSPYSRTIFKVISYLEQSRVNYPAEYVLTWLEKLDPDLLSTDTWQGTDGRGRTIEHASDREKWYTEKCKALFELNRFQECIDFGQKVLALFNKFHYRNDKWIKRRIALSYEALGAPEKAAEWIEKILDTRSEWFIQFDMARAQFQMGNLKQALKYASEAALNHQGLEFKWKLFQMMAEVLKEIGETERAKEHLLLAAKIRIENEWDIPQELHDQIVELNIDLEENKSAKQIERELRNYWKNLKLADLPKQTGYIKNIVSSGKAGFIQGDDQKDYYFRIDSFEGNKNAIESGLRVEFFIVENEDPSKRDSAIHVHTTSGK